MNTAKIREISKLMMVIGGGIFAAGLGLNITANYTEYREVARAHKKETLKIEEASLKKRHELEEAAIKARAKKDEVYADKIKSMNATEFAKFHAENTAKANAKVMAEAEQVKQQCKAELVRAQLECQEKIDSIRSNCLEKITNAEEKRDAAVKKYETLTELFDNKDEILKAKEKLEAFNKSAELQKSNREDLLNSIKIAIE